jgi:chromosome partitioning protein
LLHAASAAAEAEDLDNLLPTWSLAIGLVSRLGRLVKIVVTNLKGGVGKTTTAVYLAAVASAGGHGPVLVVDADRQASAAQWLEERPLDGVEVVEAPSERTLVRAMGSGEETVVVDLPPGDERLVQAAIGAADAVVIPTRAGGVEYGRVAYTVEFIPAKTPRGIVITSARLGTNDLQEAIDWWTEERVPIWGVIPERVGIAAGPEARLYRDGLDEYRRVLRRVRRARPHT